MVRLIAVRHGQTEWNTQGRVQGGGSLDELGHAQARSLAHRLSTEFITAAYASPTIRTKQTTRAIIRPMGLVCRVRKTLRDLDYGTFAGANLAQVTAEDPQFWAKWRSNPEIVNFPNGENLSQLRERVSRFLKEITAYRENETVLAVTHDSPIRAIVSIALCAGDERHHDFTVPTGSISIFYVEKSGLTMVSRGDVAHLSQHRDSF
jgi:broad specificity phosphatase PhoE